ncbi:proline-rich transmembrane protein 1-like [Python bivittatus]|uniref:Proline-rich transmembrane protein 1-like n=1 Tax=Python bivittatus TaxID=176946 RepID=A0A9F2QX43_PYTBI|nr:proline-rich transmembrane protein 1-like [Python bivittatus]
MSNTNYQTFNSDQPNSPNPPTYSEKDPYKESGPAGSALPTGQGATAPMPPYYGSPGSAYPPQMSQPQQTVIITPVYPSSAPDYLAYSIFTMLCCCLPLGIAALVFSIQTRDANHSGNSMAAQRNSKMARNFAHAALGVGIFLIIVYIVLMVILLNQNNRS